MDTASIIALIVAVAFIAFICYKIFKKDYSNSVVPPPLNPPVVNPGTYPTGSQGGGPEIGDPEEPVHPHHPTPEVWENPNNPIPHEDELH